ncbi:MAG: hypothetical protein ACJ735_16420 [Actinomycetes bacterium]
MTTSHDMLRRNVTFVVGSLVCMVAGAAVFAVVAHDSWNTWLLVWGLAIGVTGALQSELMIGFARRVTAGTPTASSTEDHIKLRRRINNAAMLALGLSVGLLAAAADLVWFDLAVTVLALAVWIPTSLLAIGVVRRSRRTALGS